MTQQTAIMKREEYPVDVRRLAQDIKDLLPNGNKLQDFEALALASSARALKLNPFIGEIWYIPGHGLMSGIKGHRRIAHEQMHTTEGGGNYWPEFDVMTPEQKKQYLVPDTALGFICRLYDSATLRTYSETVEKLFKAGAPWSDIKHIIGDRPYTIGVGFYQTGEASRMKPHQCAMKRAEADALKRRFDLPFEGGAATTNDNDTDNGSFSVESPDEAQDKRKAGSAALYGEPDIDLVPELKDEYNADHTGGNGKTTDSAALTEEGVKSAKLRYQPFVAWANEWVRGNGKAYARDNEPTLANMWHLLNRIGALGFAEVTQQNADDIKATLESFVKIGDPDKAQA